jgi:hypothetical protein
MLNVWGMGGLWKDEDLCSNVWTIDGYRQLDPNEQAIWWLELTYKVYIRMLNYFNSLSSSIFFMASSSLVKYR